jgi:predicted permease
MIAQVAIAVVLLTGTGLFLRTLQNFARLDVGFDRSHLIYFGVDYGTDGATSQQQADLSQRWQEVVDRLPGVQSSALLARPLLSGSREAVGIMVDNPKLAPGQNMGAGTNDVSPSFFQTLGIPLLLGRTFTDAEMEAGRSVAIVNETFVRTFLQGENPIGRAFTLPGSSVMRTSARRTEIVGVAADARYSSLRGGIAPTIYQPLTNRLNGTFVVRTAGDPRAIIPSLQSALKHLAPEAALSNVRTQQDAVDRLLTGERLFALLCSIFAVVALCLTCLGLYGLLAHDVTARTHEIGLRLALGSPVNSVMRLILSNGVKLVMIGMAIGLTTAFGVMRFIASMLFNVTPTDPVTLSGVVVVLMAVAFIACWLPARRAAKVDPMEALRCE